MAQMLVLVLDSDDKLVDVLRAWRGAGAPGITIVQSTGPGRIRSSLRDDLPLMPTLRDLLESEEIHHRTLFTVLPDDELVERVVAATHEVVGDFSRHHTGLLFTLPVGKAWGLQKLGKP